MSILTVNNLTKTFKSGLWPFAKQSTYTAVNNISFKLKKGEILGFLGANGAGKTTTIQMLLGTLLPSSGSISYFGADFSTDTIAALKKIGYASGYDRLPARLTVFENLDIIGRMYGVKQPERLVKIQKMLAHFNLSQLRDQQTGTLSAGQTTRVMLAKAFLSDPDIVLLDEPTASLDPDIASVVREFILAECNSRGVSVLITSHNMNEVTQLCDRVLVLKNGIIIADNTPEELAQSIALVKVTVTIIDGIDHAIMCLNSRKLVHSVQDNRVTIEIEEHEIAPLLTSFALQAIAYSHISIKKPTLEDYFLSLSRR